MTGLVFSVDKLTSRWLLSIDRHRHVTSEPSDMENISSCVAALYTCIELSKQTVTIKSPSREVPMSAIRNPVAIKLVWCHDTMDSSQHSFSQKRILSSWLAVTNEEFLVSQPHAVTLLVWFSRVSTHDPSEALKMRMVLLYPQQRRESSGLQAKHPSGEVESERSYNIADSVSDLGEARSFSMSQTTTDLSLDAVASSLPL
mmetsp:Transcript_5036/g.15099  ORF Transcript_5036/g.15099 Transcript_5036/m.15099 type:complete len:201 (-) Transcript_5036:1010-1612(-)